MTTADVKIFLMRYRNANREINAKLDEITQLRSLALKTTAAMGDDKVQTSAENRTEKIIAKIVDLENEVDATIDSLKDIKHEVENVIEAVPAESQKAVLRRRYINCETWEEIAVDLNYHYRWVLELHGRGLMTLSKDSIVMHTNL